MIDGQTDQMLTARKSKESTLSNNNNSNTINSSSSSSSNNTSRYEDIIKYMEMFPTGIGGFIKPGQTSDILIPNVSLPERFNGDRYLWGMNYFCLKQGDILKLHKLNQDEQWFFHEGLSIKLHIFSSNGNYKNIIIGNNIKNGDLLQGVCPYDSWFGGEVIHNINDNNNYYDFSLSSCNLSPAWDEKDSFIPSKEDIDNLKLKFPNFIDIINLLSNN